MFASNLTEMGFVVIPTALTATQVQQLKELGESFYSSGHGKRINGSNGCLLSSLSEMKESEFKVFSTTMETVLRPVRELLGGGAMYTKISHLSTVQKGALGSRHTVTSTWET